MYTKGQGLKNTLSPLNAICLRSIICRKGDHRTNEYQLASNHSTKGKENDRTFVKKAFSVKTHCFSEAFFDASCSCSYYILANAKMEMFQSERQYSEHMALMIC